MACLQARVLLQLASISQAYIFSPLSGILFGQSSSETTQKILLSEVLACRMDPQQVSKRIDQAQTTLPPDITGRGLFIFSESELLPNEILQLLDRHETFDLCLVVNSNQFKNEILSSFTLPPVDVGSQTLSKYSGLARMLISLAESRKEARTDHCTATYKCLELFQRRDNQLETLHMVVEVDDATRMILQGAFSNSCSANISSTPLTFPGSTSIRPPAELGAIYSLTEQVRSQTAAVTLKFAEDSGHGNEAAVEALKKTMREHEENSAAEAAQVIKCALQKLSTLAKLTETRPELAEDFFFRY